MSEKVQSFFILKQFLKSTIFWTVLNKFKIKAAPTARWPQSSAIEGGFLRYLAATSTVRSTDRILNNEAFSRQ